MHLFGLKRIKPLAATRFGGMRFLRVRRGENKVGYSDVRYFRHASAMSAAIAKNMSSLMSQPGELVHGTSTKSDMPSFLDTHNHYSFIAVVVLMSLFLVVTISATGLLLAFCRKKNTVFVVAPKSDSGTPMEFDDIDDSDTEMYQGHKGDCYIHLSNDYDDEDDDDFDNSEEDYEDESQSKSMKSSKKCAKRSRTFPLIRDVLKRCKATKHVYIKDAFSDEGKATHTLNPLNPSSHNPNMETDVSVVSVPLDTSEKPSNLKQQHQMKQSHQQKLNKNGRIVCNNPNHNHRHHCQRLLKQYRDGRVPIVRFSRKQISSPVAGKLQRSITIHDIPQTERRYRYSPVIPNRFCGIEIRVEDTDQGGLRPSDEKVKNLYLLPSEKHNADTDIFNDEDDEACCESRSPFDDLKLRLEDHEKDDETEKNRQQVTSSSNLSSETDNPSDTSYNETTDSSAILKEAENNDDNFITHSRNHDSDSLEDILTDKVSSDICNLTIRHQTVTESLDISPSVFSTAKSEFSLRTADSYQSESTIDQSKSFPLATPLESRSSLSDEASRNLHELECPENYTFQTEPNKFDCSLSQSKSELDPSSAMDLQVTTLRYRKHQNPESHVVKNVQTNHDHPDSSLAIRNESNSGRKKNNSKTDEPSFVISDNFLLGQKDSNKMLKKDCNTIMQSDHYFDENDNNDAPCKIVCDDDGDDDCDDQTVALLK